ncbi:MAG TPA: tetratricopeptide repeat protein [Anaerolineae bacterium]
MSQLTVRLLGPPQVEVDGVSIEVDTRKAIALLAYLAVTGQVHRRSTLAVLLWPESDQTHARTALRRTLAALNKAIGKQWLEADRTTIGLNRELEASGQVWIDANRLQQLLKMCPAEHHMDGDACARCLPLLTEAATLYRGDFLQGFTLADSPGFDEWQFFQVEAMRQAMGSILARLAHCHQLQGNSKAAIDYARLWVALDTLHEPAQRRLMELYAWAGQRGAALRQYQECVRILEEELGIAPQPETTALYERIMQGDFERQASGPGQGANGAATGSPHNLPRQLTTFVGRDKELHEIHSLLDNPLCRLVSVVGPGGIGKTRLVLEVASARIEMYRHGVFFVPLGSISSPDFLVSTIADTLNYTFYGSGRGGEDPKTQLLNFLREKEMLLVLDNFEHLLDGAELLSEILETAPRLKFLITSQERLNLMEEWLVEIQGLRCPNGDRNEHCSAFELFVQRANQVHAGFSLSEEEKPFVGRICRLVGGMPLGIELASTWVRMLSCQEIAQQIEQSLDFLATSLRNVPDRHRSLRAVFERSWRLLPEQERSVFRKLSIFPGSFQADAATAVANASLPVLMALADKSLVRRTASGRYEVLPVLRQYAREKFQENPHPEVEEHHSDYYLSFLAKQEKGLKGQQQKETLVAIGAEIQNVRRAWRWAVANEKREAVQEALTTLFIFYETQGWFEEGAETFGSAVKHWTQQNESSQIREAVTGKLLAGQGAFHVRLANYDKGKALLEQGLEILRPLDAHRAVAFALNYLGMVAEASGTYSQARKLQGESLALYRASGDQWGTGNVLNALGNVSHMLREYEASQNYYQESLAIRRQIGDRRGVALCYHNLGNVTQVMGSYDEAKNLYQKSVDIKREIGDRRGIGYSLNNLGYMAYVTGAYTEARPYLEESLATLKEVGDRRGIGYALTNLGNVAYAQAEYEQAQTLYEEALDIFYEIGDRVGIAFVLEDLGNVARSLGLNQEAKQRYVESLAAARETRAAPIMLDALTGLATLQAIAGSLASALELLAVVRIHQATSLQTRERAERLFETWAAGVAPEVVASAQANGEQKTLEQVVTELLAEKDHSDF